MWASVGCLGWASTATHIRHRFFFWDNWINALSACYGGGEVLDVPAKCIVIDMLVELAPLTQVLLSKTADFVLARTVQR